MRPAGRTATLAESTDSAGFLLLILLMLGPTWGTASARRAGRERAEPMFQFFRKPGPRSPSSAILRALESDGLPPGTDVSRLGLVESRGRFAGRKVTFFRVFDPTPAAAHGTDVFTKLTHEDLGARPDLVLRAGFVERNGAIVVSARPSEVRAGTPWSVGGAHRPRRGRAGGLPRQDSLRVGGGRA
jgi:hypothetical protein